MAHSGKTITFATDLLPNEDLIYNLGNTNAKWNIYGTVIGNATNVTGTVAVANGGTGVTTEGDIVAKYGIEYIVGARGASASAWTGTTQSSALYIGKTIAYKLSHEPSGNASLTLTFTNPSGNADSGAIAVYTNTSRVTTHYKNGSVVILTYDGTYWRASDYWNSNSRDPGYGKITPGAASNSETALTTNTTQITAGTYNEALTINPGNKWISLAGTQGASNGGDIFAIGHALSDVTAGTSSPNSAQTPSVNSTFNIPTITVDAAGHVTAMNTTTVKIPQAVTSIGTLTGDITVSNLITHLGLSTALHFVGITTTDMTGGTATSNSWTGTPAGISNYTPQQGDVVINETKKDEWVCTKVNGTTYTWERLGSDTSYKIVQSQVAAPAATTNKWVSSIGQNANGDISVSYSELNTSGTWSGTATTATNLANNPSIQTSNNTQVTITAGGKTSSAYTVPYATKTAGANITSTAYGVAYYSNTTGTFASTTAGEEGDVFVGKETAQGAITTPTWYKGLSLLGTSSANWTATFSGAVYVDKTITIASKVTLQWNATDQSLDFVFA